MAYSAHEVIEMLFEELFNIKGPGYLSREAVEETYNLVKEYYPDVDIGEVWEIGHKKAIESLSPLSPPVPEPGPERLEIDYSKTGADFWGRVIYDIEIIVDEISKMVNLRYTDWRNVIETVRQLIMDRHGIDPESTLVASIIRDIVYFGENDESEGDGESWLQEFLHGT